MQYDAITFDTQTVETNSFHFEGGLLSQLKQFKNGPVRVVVSEIVVREIFKHLVEKTRAARDAAVAAHKKAADHGLADSNNPFVAETVDIKAVASARLTKFLQEIGAEIVRPSNVPMSELVNAYFQPAPPFSAAGKNKAEFPDAIALLSLERWANSSNLKVLAVSNDRGWKAYADLHEWVDLREMLADALSLLQRGEEEANATVQKLFKSIGDNTDPDVLAKFKRLLQDELANFDMYGEADSAYSLDSDDVQLELVEFRFAGDEDEYAFSVVQGGRNVLVAEVELEVSVKAETSFYMSVYDSVDKDYTPVGSTEARTEDELTFKALVTFEREEASEPFRLSKLELIDGPNSISFGYVEPDYEPEPEENYDLPDDLPSQFDDELPF